MQDFYTGWEERFKVSEEEALVRVQDLEIAHEQQMEALNRKLDRAVENSRIKPDVKLKMMQNNEKLVAVNERIDEAMNYRKELKAFEVQESDRIEGLKKKNAENQRKKLLANQVSQFFESSIHSLSQNRFCFIGEEKRDGPDGGQNRDSEAQFEDRDGEGAGCAAEVDQSSRARHHAVLGLCEQTGHQKGQ